MIINSNPLFDFIGINDDIKFVSSYIISFNPSQRSYVSINYQINNFASFTITSYNNIIDLVDKIGNMGIDDFKVKVIESI